MAQEAIVVQMCHGRCIRIPRRDGLRRPLQRDGRPVLRSFNPDEAGNVAYKNVLVCHLATTQP